MKHRVERIGKKYNYKELKIVRKLQKNEAEVKISLKKNQCKYVYCGRKKNKTKL